MASATGRDRRPDAHELANEIVRDLARQGSIGWGREMEELLLRHITMDLPLRDEKGLERLRAWCPQGHPGSSPGSDTPPEQGSRSPMTPSVPGAGLSRRQPLGRQSALALGAGALAAAESPHNRYKMHADPRPGPLMLGPCSRGP
jgi:hypothetical protein